MEKRSITDLKNDKKRLIASLKDVSVAKNKVFLFGSHYAYLENTGMQVIMIIGSFLLGSILATISKNILTLFVPYIIWAIYDYTKIQDKVTEFNNSIRTRLAYVEELIDNHMKVKNAIENSINFLKRINKKTA